MTPLKLRTFRNICYLGLICLLAAAWGRHRKRDDVHGSPVHTDYAADRALDRSVPICQAMARPGERLQLTAEPQRGGMYPLRWAWAVDCAGEDGRRVAYLRWDGATGQLQEVSAEVPLKSLLGHTSLISERTALVDAQRCLRIAGLDMPGSHWRFGRPTYSASIKTWIVVATSHGAHLTFHIDGFTGRLIWLYLGKQSAS